jgi:phage tail sheath protein FI
LLAPGKTTDPEAIYLAAMREVLYHAAKCGDRFALLDTLAGTTPSQAAALPAKLAEPPTAKFGALYYPWFKAAVSGVERMVPPSGFVAGIIARSDLSGGVGRAPANEPVKDIVDLETVLDAVDQNDLNLVGVNCARKLEQLAVELWGARTLSADVESRYVNVRRLLIGVKKALSNSLRWAVFEPNDRTLRQRIEISLASLMRTLVAGGATASDRASDSFFVKCNDETNPPDVVAAGQIVANVGVALVAPAEFILLNVRRTPDSVSVTEEGG